MELNKIYNEDCLEGMKRIPDKSVDMILCDLPYGTTACSWDTIIPLEPLWEQYERVIKDNGAIVLTAQTPFDKVLGASNLKLLRYEWIWGKSEGTGGMNANKMPLKKHENVLIFYKKLPTYNPQFTEGKPYKIKRNKPSLDSAYGKTGTKNNFLSVNEGKRYPVSIVEFGRDKAKLHPTQKPVPLFEYLIKTYTNKNETVLDNCMGSGTTAIACMNTERNFIGFELDETYYEKSLERIKEHTTQTDIFDYM